MAHFWNSILVFFLADFPSSLIRGQIWRIPSFEPTMIFRIGTLDVCSDAQRSSSLITPSMKLDPRPGRSTVY